MRINIIQPMCQDMIGPTTQLNHGELISSHPEKISLVCKYLYFKSTIFKLITLLLFEHDIYDDFVSSYYTNGHCGRGDDCPFGHIIEKPHSVKEPC